MYFFACNMTALVTKAVASILLKIYVFQCVDTVFRLLNVFKFCYQFYKISLIYILTSGLIYFFLNNHIRNGNHHIKKWFKNMLLL